MSRHRSEAQQKDAPNFQRRVEFSDSARMLIEKGDDLLWDRENEADRDVVSECLAAILGKLQRHPLFHSQFVAQYRTLIGDPTAVISDAEGEEALLMSRKGEDGQ